MPGPLEGIRILDLPVALTGPLATGMLVDQGASCVKVEQAPTGDLVRWIGTSVNGISAMFQVANRGKRSIVLDIRSEEGMAILSDLVADADVLVQNFRPGVAERLGIAYSDMAALKPDLIYADLTGYGPTGPYSHRRVYDTAIQAQSGLADNQTGLYDNRPSQLRQLAADKITAYTASQAITAALFSRQMGRGGQHIQLSMLDACIAFLFVDGADHEVILDGDHSGPQAAASQVTPYVLVDGFVSIAAPDDTGFHGLATAFGVDSSDPDLAHAPDRSRNREKFHKVLVEIREKATTFTVSEAEELLEANNVPFGAIRRVDEVPTDPQVVANELFSEHDHPAAGRVRQHRAPAQFLGTPAQMTEPSAPTLGQHTDQVVAETGRGNEIANLREAGVIA